MNDDSPPGMEPDQRLDDLLRRHAQAPLPPVPGNLESRVWREIRARRAAGSWERPADPGGDWLAGWLRLWRNPRVALAGAVATVLIGVGMSWPGLADARSANTRQALDLGVFSAEAPSLPSTLLIAPVGSRE